MHYSRAMKLHARTRHVQRARAALDEFLLNLEQEHQLTCPEILSLLGQAALHGNTLPHTSLHENCDGLHDY